MRRRSVLQLATIAVFLLVPLSAMGEQPVRVASYNIYFLKSTIGTARVNRLKQVIDVLDADVIGLQEIDDRAALERVFDPSKWLIVIDDASDDNQDVAVVIRKPFKVKRRDGSAFDLHAKDADFLFPEAAHNAPFPNRRDALCVLVELPNNGGTFHFVVNHWKARRDGRRLTDPRREEAASLLAHKIEHDFDGKRVIVVGDFNDNPDDKSMNILETGSDTAIGGPEEQDGPLLINAMDKLAAQDVCSWGTKVVNGQLQFVVPGSRAVNNAGRGTTGNSSPILFDQILFPLSMMNEYVPDSAHAFANAVARQGTGPNGDTPSDHIPVFADFVFDSTTDNPGQPDQPAGAGGLRITRLMVNPNGEDRGHEWIELKNAGTADAPLAGWRLRDRSNNELSLSGSVPANNVLKVDDPQGQMPLSNGGDEIVLVNPQNQVVHRAQYASGDVHAGQPIVAP